jgi:hypothetical protein
MIIPNGVKVGSGFRLAALQICVQLFKGSARLFLNCYSEAFSFNKHKKAVE